MGGNRMRLEDNWNQAKERIRESWASLTDDELDETQGDWEKLVGTIQARTGEAIPVIERKLDDIADSTDEKAA